MSGAAGLAFIGPMPQERRGRGRPRGTCGPVRAALGRAIAQGVTGSLEVLAAHTGWPPEYVRRAVREMRRADELALLGTEPTPGQRGQPAGVYGLQQPTSNIDALAFSQKVWR